MSSTIGRSRCSDTGTKPIESIQSRLDYKVPAARACLMGTRGKSPALLYAYLISSGSVIFSNTPLVAQEPAVLGGPPFDRTDAIAADIQGVRPTHRQHAGEVELSSPQPEACAAITS